MAKDTKPVDPKDPKEVREFVSSEIDERTFEEGALYDFYKPHAGAAVVISDWSPSLTRQEFAEECDINVIMSRYERTGQLPMNMNGVEPRYVDMSAMPTDFREAMDIMIEAEKAFMMLPANVRREFDNDAKMFVDFASMPENLSKMREWGLAVPEKPADAGGGGAQPPSAEPAAAPSAPASAKPLPM
ncbi:internal scaffolding protein [Blackfly microvirus SF02]|uniref:Internal scaffolding protein n=1 Tax=Blackfly microvirus SF02 TaxID=2576452 RepID=A0A4P8PJM3_9VIRU|nr:internal scaffolding protein [Blackfly microvirus SF02]